MIHYNMKGGDNMDMTTIIQLISSVGFPIAMCIYAIYTLNRQTETHKAEIDELRTTIENNTQAITALASKL